VVTTCEQITHLTAGECNKQRVIQCKKVCLRSEEIEEINVKDRGNTGAKLGKIYRKTNL